VNASHPSTPAAAHWLSLAGQTRTRINLAWWWQTAAPLVSIVTGISCAVILWFRANQRDFSLPLAAGILGSLLLICLLAAWLRSKRYFVSLSDGLVQLEHRLKLNNALTSAAAGRIGWPEPTVAAITTDGLKWKPASILVPGIILLGCLSLAFLLPVVPPEETKLPSVPLPSAAQAAENLIRELDQAEVARKEDLEKFQQAVDSLKEKAPEEWYQHASLEAADHVKDSLTAAANQLGQNYQQTSRSLEKLASESVQASPAMREQAAQELANALKGLQNGSLQPNQELMKKLQQIDPAQVPQMSPEEREQLQKELQRCQGACQPGNQPSERGADEQAMREALENGEEGGEAENEIGQQGPGDPERGPGTTDLKPKKEDTNLNTNHLEKEQTKDLTRLAPGDLLGTSDGEHAVDKTTTGAPQDGQGSNALGKGGDAVFKENLLPEEKRALRKFFK
jgi:hypothetical protein